jgi:hypothetical protein
VAEHLAASRPAGAPVATAVDLAAASTGFSFRGYATGRWSRAHTSRCGRRPEAGAGPVPRFRSAMRTRKSPLVSRSRLLLSIGSSCPGAVGRCCSRIAKRKQELQRSNVL